MPVYLKYGSIKGDVKEPAYRGWIELNSAQLGAHNLGGTGTGLHTPDDMLVTKNQDSASALLFQEVGSGKATFATIDFVKEGSVYLRVEMTGTMVSSINVSGRGGGQPMESLTLNFEKFVYKQTPGEPPK